MEKHTLTFVGRYTTKKDGSPLVSKTGKPYTSLRIKTNAHGDRYLSGFENAGTKSWKVGDTVEIEVEEKNGYLNFETPKTDRPGGGVSSDQFNMIMREVRAINSNVLRVISLVDPEAKLTSAGTPVPDFTPATMNVSTEEVEEAMDAFGDPWEGMDVK